MSKENGQRSTMDKFKGDNYDAWAYRVRTKLASKGLWSYVEKEVEVPETATAHEKLEHDIKLAKAKDKIVKMLDVNVIELIQNIQSPHEIWETLANIYLKKQFGNVVQAFFNYICCKFDKSKDMLTHINLLRHRARSIKDMTDLEIPEQIQVLVWLYSIKDVFGSLVEGIKMREQAPDRNGLQKILLSKYEEWKEEEDKKDPKDTALVAKGSDANRTKANQNKIAGRCYYCDKPNHMRSVCRRRIADERNGIYRECIHMPAYQPRSSKDDYRQRRSHSPRYRRSSGYQPTSTQSHYDRGYYSKPHNEHNEQRKYANVGVSAYGSPGYVYATPEEDETRFEHFDRKRPRSRSRSREACESKRSCSDYRGEKIGKYVSVQLAYDREQKIDLTPTYETDILRLKNRSIALSCIKETTKCKNTTWILDSGATRHMTFEKKYFISLSFYSGDIYVADNRSLQIEGIGDISLSISVNNKLITLNLKKVYYIPTLEFNLLSIPQATKDRQISFKFDHTEYAILRLRNGIKVVARKLPTCQLYYFRVCPPLEVGLVIYESQEKKLKRWHERLGHPGKTAMLKMNEEYHLQLSNKLIDNFYCEDCIKGKMTKLPFQSIDKHTQRYLEKVCGDVYYVECASYNGYRYYIVLVDDYTSFSFILLLKERSEFRFKLEQWYQEVIEGGRYVLNTIQLDRAGEFIDADVKDLCVKHGVKLQYTLARQHQQNGLAERKIRTLNDKQRTMLHAGNFPIALWAEAVMTANDILNISPAKRNRNRRSPYYMKNGRSPLITGLRTFGCVAWAYIDVENRTKLSQRAVKCIFVGYLRDSKGYRLLELDTMKPILTRNVLFIENIYATIPKEIPQNVNASYREVPSVTNESHMDSLFKHVEHVLSPSKSSPEIASNEERTGSDQPKTSQERTDESPKGGTIDRTEDMSDKEDNPKLDESVPVNYTDESETETKDKESRLEKVDKGNEEGNLLIEKIKRQKELLANSRKELTLKKLQQWCEQRNKADKENVKDHAMLTYCLLSNKIKDENDKIQIPRTIWEAMNSEYSVKWVEATDNEYKSLMKNETWVLTERPEDKKVLKCKWVFVVKYDENGSIERFKARLVIKGYEETYGVDYDEIFSPVLRFETLRFLLTFGAVRDYEIHQMDVKTAFLNGEIDNLYIWNSQKATKKKIKNIWYVY